MNKGLLIKPKLHTMTVSRRASTLQKNTLKATSRFETKLSQWYKEKINDSDRHRLKYTKLHSSILFCLKLFFPPTDKAWWNIFRDLTTWMTLSVQMEMEEAMFALQSVKALLFIFLVTFSKSQQIPDLPNIDLQLCSDLANLTPAETG